MVEKGYGAMTDDERLSTDETVRLKIERRAYEIWESEGRLHGCAVDHWLRAEAEISCTGSREEPDELKERDEREPTRLKRAASRPRSQVTKTAVPKRSLKKPHRR